MSLQLNATRVEIFKQVYPKHEPRESYSARNYQDMVGGARPEIVVRTPNMDNVLADCEKALQWVLGKTAKAKKK